MNLSKISTVFFTAAIMVLTVGLITGCGSQDSATVDNTGAVEATEETSSQSENHEGHDHNQSDHEDEDRDYDESRPEHYEGEQIDSWDQALTQLREHNQKLSKLLEKDELSEWQMEQIHELTYTLENALGHVRGELDQTAETLEKVHLASEKREADTVRKNAERYLDSSGRLTN